MTAYITIATAIIVVAIALASWLLHKKIARECGIVYAAIHSRSDHAIGQLANAERSIRSHVVDEIDGLGLHVTTEVSKVSTDLRTHASQAVHEAIVTVRGVKHETCQGCGKVSNIWKIVDGKVECADCSIRKLVS